MSKPRTTRYWYVQTREQNGQWTTATTWCKTLAKAKRLSKQWPMQRIIEATLRVIE